MCMAKKMDARKSITFLGGFYVSVKKAIIWLINVVSNAHKAGSTVIQSLECLGRWINLFFYFNCNIFGQFCYISTIYSIFLLASSIINTLQVNKSPPPFLLFFFNECGLSILHEYLQVRPQYTRWTSSYEASVY